MNDTNEELEYFFEKVDKEFQTLEGTIKNTLKKIHDYEK